MEVRADTGLPDIQTTDVQVLYSFNKSEARIMEDGFMSSAILPRHPGGHSLAMPTWTIVPMLYHKPPDYNTMSRTGRPVNKDDKSEDRELFQEDDYGTVWKIKSEERLEHNHAMKCVQKHASEGLFDMKNVKYYEAVTKFWKALKGLWPCHRNTPLERWIKTHRGHALLRAGLLECPAIHGKKTSELLQTSFETFSECVGPLRSLQNCGDAASSFNRSLLFSGLLGLAWIFFFRGNMEEAEGYIAEAQTVHLEPTHMRSYMSPAERRMLRLPDARQNMMAPVDLDTFFFKVALRRVIGSLNDLESLFNKLGNELSKFEEDCTLEGLLEKQYSDMKGEFEASVHLSCKPEEIGDRYHSGTEPAVANFLDRLEAGYSGNTWFAVGANQQARAAYECALASGSVLLRAAALVGLGNVFMRLGVSVRSCTKADESKLGFAEAEKKYTEALEIYEEFGFMEGKIIVQCNLGNLYHKRGQLQQALEQYTTIETYFSEKMDKGLAALQLHLKLAELHLDMEDWEEKAFNSIRKAAALSSTNNNRLARAWVEHLSGSYYLKKALATEGEEEQLMKDLDVAKIHLQDAVKFLAGIQVGVGVHTSLWLVIFEQQKETYALLLWCIACQLDKSSSTTSAVEALVWSERSRSRASMAGRWDRFFPSVRGYFTDEPAVLTALEATACVNDTLPYEESWNHLQVLLSRCKELATTVVEYVLCADFGFLIFVLNKHEGEPKMLRVSFKEQELNGEKLDREKLIALVNETVFLLSPKSSGNEEDGKEEDEKAKANLAILYKLLIKPVEKWLEKTHEGKKEDGQIIVIPHEVLFKVPFHALIDGGKKYLIERFKLSCAESIRSLVQCSLLWERNTHLQRVQDDHHDSVPDDEKTRKRWLVVGIDKHRPVAADLRHAELEAKKVSELLGEEFKSMRIAQSQVFTGSEATKEQVKPHFGKADIIHLATHGIINAKYERGGILFKTPADVQSSEKVTSVVDFEPSHSVAKTFETTTRSVVDYHKIADYLRMQSNKSGSLGEKVVLSASEISDMNLKAQLVVLSACQSADGVILGEGVAGLGRALLEAGVPCTVLSLWPVSDRATIFFMTEFYKGLARGRPVADAMKAAMETMINKTKLRSEERKYTVRHWAAFLVYGYPDVRVADPSLPALGSQLITGDKRPQQLNSGSLFLTIEAFALAPFSRIKDWTRSTMREVYVPYAWNPLSINPHAPMKPKSRGLPSLTSEKKMVIYASLFASYFIHTGGLHQLDHASLLSLPLCEHQRRS